MEETNLSVKDKKKKFFRRHYIFRSLLRLVFTALVIIFCLKFIVRPYYQSGTSMHPSIRDGDLGILYLLEDKYYNNEIIAYIKDNEIRLGRIVATTGQKVDFPEKGGYTVDGYGPNEDLPYETHLPEGNKLALPIKVKDNQYFVLNDYRSNDKDSRTYGVISKEDIIGKIVLLFRRRGF